MSNIQTRNAVKHLKYRVNCPECVQPVPNILEDYSSGDVICMDCGSVLMDRLIDLRGEWRTFSNDAGGSGYDPNRVGAPSNALFMTPKGDYLLESTVISKTSDGSNAGKDLSRLQNRSFIMYSQSGSSPGVVGESRDKNLIKAFQEIDGMCERIGLPKIISDRSKTIYKNVDNEKLLKGRTMEGVIAACIYIACRQEKVPRTFKEISALTLVPKKDIGRCYKVLSQAFNVPSAHALYQQYDDSLGNGSEDSVKTSSGASSPSPGLGTVTTQDFMARFCSHLDLNIEIQKHVLVLCARAQDTGCVSGKSPISIAAAGIYMITQLFPRYKKTQKEIAYVAGVSEVTIKNTYKYLYLRRYELIPPEMAPRIAIDALPAS